MKYLKIKDNKGFFLKETEKSPAEWVSIDQITRCTPSSRIGDRRDMGRMHLSKLYVKIAGS
jgi:hypothetical protein